MNDNICKTQSGEDGPQYSGDPSYLVEYRPTWHDSIQTMPASSVQSYMVENVGARPWDRDAIDARYIDEMLSDGKQGALIDWETEVEGYPTYSPTYRPFDPDDWNLDDLPITKRTPY